MVGCCCTSTTTSSGPALSTGYHAPRRKAIRIFTTSRAHRVIRGCGPASGLMGKTVCDGSSFGAAAPRPFSDVSGARRYTTYRSCVVWEPEVSPRRARRELGNLPHDQASERLNEGQDFYRVTCRVGFLPSGSFGGSGGSMVLPENCRAI